VYDTIIDPLVWEGEPNYLAEFIGLADDDDNALVGDPTFFIGCPWTVTFGTLAGEIHNHAWSKPNQLYWIDVFDCPINVSAMLPETWWAEVFGAEHVDKHENGIIFGEYPFNAPILPDDPADLAALAHPVCVYVWISVCGDVCNYFSMYCCLCDCTRSIRCCPPTHTHTCIAHTRVYIHPCLPPHSQIHSWCFP
jgi:hypothetical protein